jgi:hypothetical protein
MSFSELVMDFVRFLYTNSPGQLHYTFACFPFGRTCERRTGRLGPNRRNAGKLASPYPQASNLK